MRGEVLLPNCQLGTYIYLSPLITGFNLIKMFTNLSCCGIKEIGNLSGFRTPEKAMISVCEQEESFGIILFSEISEWRKDRHLNMTLGVFYAKNFSELITKNKLGSVIETESVFNPNSENKIKAYLWNVDNKALKSWYKKRNSIRKKLEVKIAKIGRNIIGLGFNR